MVTVDFEAVIPRGHPSGFHFVIEAVSAKGVVLGSANAYFYQPRNHETLRITLSESEIRRVVKLNNRIKE